MQSGVSHGDILQLIGMHAHQVGHLQAGRQAVPEWYTTIAAGSSNRNSSESSIGKSRTKVQRAALRFYGCFLVFPAPWGSAVRGMLYNHSASMFVQSMRGSARVQLQPTAGSTQILWVFSCLPGPAGRFSTRNVV